MDIKNRLHTLYSCRSTLWKMSLKQLKTKYSGSLLGLWWAVITPCILALSINFIFSRVFKMHMPNFTFFVLSAMSAWMFFSNTLSEIASCFTNTLVRETGKHQLVCLFNPMTYYVISYQKILFEAKPPSAVTLGLCFLIGFVFLFSGYYFFLKKESSLLKRL